MAGLQALSVVITVSRHVIGAAGLQRVDLSVSLRAVILFDLLFQSGLG